MTDEITKTKLRWLLQYIIVQKKLKDPWKKEKDKLEVSWQKVVSRPIYTTEKMGTDLSRKDEYWPHIFARVSYVF